MVWLREHKSIWRLAALALLVVALLGPWWFDRIYMEAQYPCSAPFIRLEGSFCGTPEPMTLLLFIWVGGSIEWVIRWAMGATVPAFDRSLLVLLWIALVLPFLTSLPLLLRDHRRSWRVIHILVWALAIILALVIALDNSPRWAGVLWGNWLYLGVAAGALILEVTLLVAGRKPRAGASS